MTQLYIGWGPQFEVKPNILMFLPMEIIVPPKKLSIVQISTLKAIQSLGMVVHAISLLCKKRESVNSFVSFPSDYLTIID